MLDNALSVHKLETEDFYLGPSAAAASLTGGYIALRGSTALMETAGYKINPAQSFFLLPNQIGAIKNSLVRGALKAFSVFSIVILAPIVEEWLFRYQIYKWQEEDPAPKAYRIMSNAVIFGAFHYSIFLGMANIPIVLCASISGIVFATLREMRGNCYASVIAHSINNAVLLLLYKG